MAAPQRPSRRAVLRAGGAGVAGAALGAFGARQVQAAPPALVTVVPFYGRHQAGILTPPQRHVTLAVVDLTLSTAADLETLLRQWTTAAARMTSGAPAEQLTGLADAVPADTGEAADSDAARLTVTVGFGAGLFDGRFGLADRRPEPLVALPHFGKDQLDPSRTGGDLVIQASADWPHVAEHAVRNLLRLTDGAADLRWLQHGSSSGAGRSPRNVLGFRDGTGNLDVRDDARMRRNVWASVADRPWMQDGSYLVVRRVRALVEHWDTTKLSVQEASIGRRKVSGAPLGGRSEGDPVEPAALPADSHVRLANPRTGTASEDERLLRRGYNYADGLHPVTGPVQVKGKPVTGQQDAGLLFLAYQQDPRRQFIPIQTRLDADDHLNEYLVHTGSGVFAIAPGVRGPGDYFGSALLRRATGSSVPTGPLIRSALGSGLAAVGGPAVAYSDGASVQVLSLLHFDPSEYAHGHLRSRRAAAFLVQVHNGTQRVLDLAPGIATAVAGAAGIPVGRIIDLPKYDETAGRFSGTLAPGASSRTSLAFDLPPDQVHRVVLKVSLGPRYVPLHFVGSVH